MKKTGVFRPYTPAGNYTLKVTAPGVYILREAGRIVYIGFSGTDVRKTMYRHFQKWTDKRHPDNRRAYLYDRVTYKGKEDKFTAQVFFCKTSKEAAALENALILKYEPRDNAAKLDIFSAGVKRDVLSKAEAAALYSVTEEENPF